MKTTVLVLPLLLLCGAAYADRFCFTYAENYYEQIYCEVQASGQGKDLPGFYDFRRNDEMMQALLLKRFARRIGIELKMPVSSAKKVIAPRAIAPTVVSQQPLAACERVNNSIDCAGEKYHLVGNRTNKHLKPGMLKASNRMDMPSFRGSLSDRDAVERYLRNSYQHYLLKMLDIGLGGSTLSYGKFAYLFDDLNSKGVSFGKRFEAMYGYLKKDKKTLSVPAKSQAPSELTLDDCYRLDVLLVCRLGVNNWLFMRQ